MQTSEITTFLKSINQKWLSLSLFILILLILCLPIWSVDNYVNQDGTPHLYNAYLITEILKDNQNFTQSYQLNPVPIPNLTGHWLLVFLLLFFTPQTVTKIIVTLTFVLFVAAIGWLRWQTVGREGLNTSLLIGAVLALNWMWFFGFYNFIIGVIGVIFTIGLFWHWRNQLNLYRTLILAVLVVLVFLSHIISFGMLIVGLIALSFSASKENLLKSLSWLFVAILPSLPLLIGYRFVNRMSGEIFPVWRNLENPFSISNWILHLQAADPFQLLSRKAFPFIATDSTFFAVFSPFLWLFFVLACILLATFFYYKKSKFSFYQNFVWLMIPFLSVLFWVFAPDDFGSSHGAFLRERVLLCGLIFFIPLFRFNSSFKFKIPIQIILGLIIIFQISVIWEYSLSANSVSQQFLLANQEIKPNESFGSILLIENGCRFKPIPETSLSPLLGIGKTGKVWDNYEIGYYIFPIVAKDSAEKQFSFEFRDCNTYILCNPENISDKIAKLDSLLQLHHSKFDVMLVFGNDERINRIIKNWFEEKPYYQTGNLRLFRHK